ncbi:LysR family transcriptional regulator [Actinoplanes sichuanensis]|uniref:LysR family transcriptional regulator n=1 Tax=Actinoplanes sichuanensis TaxID=512349 RepID=A0ABW4A737_9ACTN|nr:LysR family transcriptional regulator [Actinoplanes sichuanensis]BEL03356.1 LysR family transcriptional regulator [Actinoplanes sichuanensis]
MRPATGGGGTDVLDRNEIEVLLTLAEQLHVGRTAERLHLPSARVTRIIQRLERRIGASLFVRNSRVVGLTPVGARLVGDLAPHVAGIEAAVRRAVEASRGIRGTLRAGFAGAVAGRLLLGAVATFNDRHPGCTVHVHETRIADAAHGLDFLITAPPVDGMRVGPVLLAEPWVLAVARGHPLAARAEVTRDVLINHPVIRLRDGAVEESRIYRPPAGSMRRGPEAGTFPEALALVAAGRGVFPVGEQAARFSPRPDVVLVPMPDLPPVRWATVWPAGGESALLRAFLDLA